jgi:anti-sigma factor RsiW
MRASVLPIVCERVRGQVSLLLDGELSELEQRMVAAHLDRCADCREFETDVRRITVGLRTTPLESPRQPIVVSRRQRRVSYGAIQVSAAAMLVVGVLGLASQLAPPTEQTVRQAGPRTENLFGPSSWQPEVELAQIEPAEPMSLDDRPGPTPAL